MRNKLTVGITLGFVVGLLFSAVTIVLAGNLVPSGGPANPDSQMYTLQQIYEQLTTGTTSEKMEAFTEPVAGPGTGTMVTLDEIMAAAPVIHTNAATQTGVLSGTVVWGLSGDAWGVITGTRPYLPVPKTGQISCFRTVGPWGPCECGTEDCPVGQDGDWQRGLETIPPALRFTVISGTVTDNMTGLIWLQNAHCPGPNDESYPGLNWFDAIARVAELNATGGMTGTDNEWRDCGDTSNVNGTHQTDWRMPNVRELLSLTDYSRYDPSLPLGRDDPDFPFINVWSRWYWSSTTHAYSEYWNEAWFVSMYGGRVQHIGKNAVWGPDEIDAFKLYVWPVRGGQE